MKKSKQIKKDEVERFDVPIYRAVVYIGISKDVRKLRDDFVKYFGETPTGDFGALCSWDGKGRFGLFFSRQKYHTDEVAHEVFHLTHQIMNWIGHQFDAGNHESHAYLCGWLTEKVCSLGEEILKREKENGRRKKKKI